MCYWCASNKLLTHSLAHHASPLSCRGQKSKGTKTRFGALSAVSAAHQWLHLTRKIWHPIVTFGLDSTLNCYWVIKSTEPCSPTRNNNKKKNVMEYLFLLCEKKTEIVLEYSCRDELLVKLSVWSKVQMIWMWSSWCHCHPINKKTGLSAWWPPNISAWKQAERLSDLLCVKIEPIFHRCLSVHF